MSWEGNRMSEVDNSSYWITGNGPKKNIVISSRIRLARNINEIPFPGSADEEYFALVVNKVKDAVNKVSGLQYLDINELSEIKSKLLVEKNLVSPIHLKSERERGVFLNQNENISIMVNEEDHMRIQVLLPGLQLLEAWKVADNLDDIFEQKIDYAFSQKWGYLTACPTNLGTGLRASVMVHLPALSLTDNIDNMLSAVSKLGLVVRGIYGEGSKAVGNLYQISNQVTLGTSEKEIIDNLRSVTAQVIEKEKQTRNILIEKHEVEVRDRINRSFGMLKFAYKISLDEAMKLLSYTKLGIDLGVLNDNEVNRTALDQLVVLIRPAHLQERADEKLSSEDCDIERANLIQNRI